MVSGTAPAQTITTGDPTAMNPALVEMGYKPSVVELNNGNPLIRVLLNDFETGIVFGGCIEGKACKYLILVSRFTDIQNPPTKWVNAQNADLDLGKVWVSEDGILSFSMPVPLAGQAISRPTLRFVLDQWSALIGTVAQSAMKESLIK